MKISKSNTSNIDENIAFDSVIEAIFEYKKLNIKTWKEDSIILISFNNEIGSDYNFNYNFFCEGNVAKLVIIKELSSKIFGEPVDGRKILDNINNNIALKTKLKTVKKENSFIKDNNFKKII